MDIMLDLETLGVRCGSVILSIGACVMERDLGFMGQGFHVFLKPKPQMAFGGTIDPSTVLWWLAQSDAARAAMVSGQDEAVQPTEALLRLNAWMDMVCPEVPARKVWANGADFDISLLSDLYRRFGMEAPWPYNAARDMRTVLDLAGGFKPAHYKAAPIGAHDALVDATYQADVTAAALKRIFKGETP